MNSVQIIGRLCRDADIRYTSGDDPKCVANFLLAVDRLGRNGGADFIPVTAWGRTAEVIEKYTSKGKQVAIVGRFTSDNYEDRDGNRRTKYFVTCERLDLLGGATTQGGGENRSTNESEPSEPMPDFAELDDFVPF